jgi:hypothetical protein
MHADKTNRSMLIVLSLIFIAAGVLGIVAGAGALGATTKHGALTHNRIGAFIGRNGDWLWPVIALVVLALVVSATRWLLALLFSTDRAGDLSFRTQGEVRGRTTLSQAALTSAVAGEIQSYRGVHAARARLVGDQEDPALVVEVTLEQTADLSGLRSRIETEALAHARQATGKPGLPIRLDLAVTVRRASRTV